MDRRWLVSRRALLGGVGALGLTTLLPRTRVRAAGPGVPTRFLFVHVPEGMWNGAQRPAAGATTLGPIMAGLDAHKDTSVLVLKNLNMKSRDQGPGGDGHHRGVVHMLTGTEMKDESNAGGISVDQKIAGVIGADSKFASLQFAARIVYNDTNSRPIWSAPGRVVPAVQDPWEAYKRIFGGVAKPAMGSTPTTPAVAAFDLRRSALDYALAELPVLRAKLPAGDRDRLDSYQESLRDIERRLDMIAGGASDPAAAGCAPPTLGTAINVSTEPNFPKIAQLQMDIIVAAFQCNVTRVASLQLGNSNDQNTYSWLGVNTLGHDLSHNNSNCDPTNAKKLKVYQWYTSQFAALLDKLKSIPEADGTTMLDNTVILWASEFGDSNGHTGSNLMWTLMGNAGGYFKSGQVIDCGGRSTNDLHVSLLNAFGIADTKFGNPAYCAGALPINA